MGTFIEITELIGTYFIRGISISILVIIFSRKLFKKNFQTQNAVSIIRWVLLSYSILITVLFLLLFFLPENSNVYTTSFRERATGAYNIIFWIMTLISILPLILLFKKADNNIYFILAVTILMSSGWLFESFIIHITSMEMGYSENVASFKAYLPFSGEVLILIRGIFLGVLTMLIGNSPFFNKKRRISLKTPDCSTRL